MKEGFTVGPQVLGDGSLAFGNGIIGPSRQDPEDCNSFFPKSEEWLERMEKEFIGDGLVVGSSESSIGKFLQNFLRRTILRPRFVLPVAGLVAFLSTACETRAIDSKRITPESLPESGGLALPFPRDPSMKVQQGWVQTGGGEHRGIDYIKGIIDNSNTWQSFAVLAAVDGQACANPSSREGEAVLIQHNLKDRGTVYTYYGHLKRIEGDIPECGSGQKKLKSKGEKVGDAGDTGTEHGWIHLHFQVNGSDGKPIDPYDLRATRDRYPDPNLTNGNTCGKETLWINCPKGEVLGVKTVVPTYTPIARSTETPIPPTLISPAPHPTPVPVFKVEAANSRGTQIGITVRRGDRLTFRAYGSWCSGGIKAPGIASCGEPEGIRPAGQGEEYDLVLKDYPVGMLIGRIDNWIFPVGNGTTIIAQADGTLLLLMNDRYNYYADNSGVIRVEFEIVR